MDKVFVVTFSRYNEYNYPSGAFSTRQEAQTAVEQLTGQSLHWIPSTIHGEEYWYVNLGQKNFAEIYAVPFDAHLLQK